GCSRKVCPSNDTLSTAIRGRRVEKGNRDRTSRYFIRGGTKMNNQKRTESPPITFARATPPFLALVVMGYAVSANTAPTDSIPAGTAPQDLEPTAYFPAQYVNQGKTLEEHIQAF